jgi:ABC-2 type transport system ATP-binding protein
MGVLVECEGLKKRFGKKQAVKGIDLSIDEHDIFGLIGPNGAGKSTLIKMMTGLIWPDEGWVSINGYDVHEEHMNAMHKVGAIIEWPAFIPYLTARQNLQMLSGGSGEEFEKELEDVADFVNMKGNLDRKILGFSTGMKQRMGIALSLIPKSRFVILDEPTNGLDPNGIAEVRDIIKERNDKFGTTIVLSSHLLGEIESICNKIAIVHNGEVVVCGNIQELLKGRRYVTVRSDNSEKAFDIIREKIKTENLPGKDPSMNNGTVRFEVTENCAADVNTALVNSGIRVSHISCDAQTLEQYFAEITGGQTDV